MTSPARTSPSRTAPPAPGFADPVLDAQRCFRSLLAALAGPMQALSLDACPPSPPEPLGPAAAAVALTLFDADTPVWLDPRADRPEIRDFLLFHCGCPLTPEPGEAAFALLLDPAAAPRLSAFRCGEEEYPDRSATLVLQVDAFDPAGPVFRGPGIETSRRLAPRPLPPGFWDQARANHALYPLGVDVFFVAGAQLAGLPRTTAIEEAV
ncbi:MAG: phosphonate C-P lyase system protein PhnH [Acidobacteria bacterium]|nr:phosphonate C-P lyase system protein PhnH [Acidobacteriota bacterium]